MLQACVSGALTRRGPEAAFSFAPSLVCSDGGSMPGMTAVLRPEGLCHKGGTLAAAEMQRRGRHGAVAGPCYRCRSAGHQLYAPGHARHFVALFPPP